MESKKRITNKSVKEKIRSIINIKKGIEAEFESSELTQLFKERHFYCKKTGDYPIKFRWDKNELDGDKFTKMVALWKDLGWRKTSVRPVDNNETEDHYKTRKATETLRELSKKFLLDKHDPKKIFLPGTHLHHEIPVKIIAEKCLSHMTEEDWKKIDYACVSWDPPQAVMDELNKLHENMDPVFLSEEDHKKETKKQHEAGIFRKKVQTTRAPGPKKRRFTVSTALLKKMLIKCLEIVDDYERQKFHAESPNVNLAGTTTSAQPTDFVDLDKKIDEPKTPAPDKKSDGLDLDTLLGSFK